MRTLMCCVCGETDGVKQCARCQVAIYCGEACSAADWPAHRAECASKCLDYDASAECKKLMVRYAAQPELRQYLVNAVRTVGAQGVNLAAQNAHDARVLNFECAYIGDASAYEIAGGGPLRPGLDFMLRIQVRLPLQARYAALAWVFAMVEGK